MALFIFDFDHTIVNGHTHNWLMEHMTEAVASSPKLQWDLVKHMPPIGSAEQWLALFKQLREAGHQIAIASYGTYGKTIIPLYLREVIGVPQAWLDQMPIQSWLPMDSNDNKNKHISQIIKELQYKDYMQTIVLIDDSIDILHAARKMGCSVIEATPDAMHLRYAATLSNIQIYANSQTDQKGLVFGNTLPDLITAEARNAISKKKDNNSNYRPLDFMLVSSKDIVSTIQQYKIINSFVLTNDCELYFVDRAQRIDKYNLNKDALIQCLQKNGLLGRLAKTTEKPISIMKQVSDVALADINQLIMATMAIPAVAQSNATLFTPQPDEKADKKGHDPDVSGTPRLKD